MISSLRPRPSALNRSAQDDASYVVFERDRTTVIVSWVNIAKHGIYGRL
jgi:hypothetical protein